MKSPALLVILRAMSGSNKSPKQLGTIRSRRIHYLKFVQDIGLTDDWLLQDHVPHERRNWQLALYLVHLASGNNLWCKALKVDTLRQYIRDVARFLHRFCPIDPRYAHAGDKEFAPCLQAVFVELQRWETVPKKQEPYTIQMQDYLETLAAEVDDDSLLSALVDWFNNGLLAGYRLSEWAQVSQNSTLDSAAVDATSHPTLLSFHPSLHPFAFSHAKPSLV